MRRRAMITAGTAFCAGTAARTQISRSIARIGVLIPAAEQFESEPFLEGMRDAGFVQGRNLQIELRSAEAAPERLPARARGLAEGGVDDILAVNTPAALAAAAATTQ